MESIKKIGTNLVHTPIGTLGGAVATYFIAKKHVEKNGYYMA